LTIDHIQAHIRDRAYMSGVERDAVRIRATQEIFTPTLLVQEILDRLDPQLFQDPDQEFIDPTCGDGQFLGEVLIRKVENGIFFEQALACIYGVDLMQDNVDLCRERLLCGREDLRHIVEQNIVCADGLKYKYNFPPMSDARRKREEVARKRQQKAREKAAKEAEQKRILQATIELEKKLFGEALTV